MATWQGPHDHTGMAWYGAAGQQPQEKMHGGGGVHACAQLGSSAVLADGLGLVRALQEHAVSLLLALCCREATIACAMGWQDKVLGWETVWHS